MRLLSAALVVALAASTASAADKDQDKAKEAAAAFLKAVKAKDLDAVMKTVDVPFLMERKEPIAKTEDLKATLKELLEDVKPERVPDAGGMVLDLPALKKKLEGKKGNEKILAQVEKVIGKTGFVVMLESKGKEEGVILVRIKDGQAKIVGIVE